MKSRRLLSFRLKEGVGEDIVATNFLITNYFLAFAFRHSSQTEAMRVTLTYIPCLYCGGKLWENFINVHVT